MEAHTKDKLAPAPARSALAMPVGSNPLAAALAGYEQGKYNFATPITVLDRVPPMHRVSIRVVTIDPRTETYPIPGSDKVGLGKTALDKIAAAAAIAWLPERSGQVDAWNDAHRVKYRAVARIRDFDGRTRTVYAEKEVDLRGEPGWPEEQLGSDAREFVRIAKKKDRDPWPQIFQQRQHIASLAESKAKLRCIRSAIGLPTAMDPKDAAKPFVVPALVPDLDTSDPEIKRMVAASLLDSESALYGAPPLAPGAQAPAKDEPEAIDVSGMEEAPEEPTTITPELPPEEAAAPACGLPITEAILEAARATRAGTGAEHVQAIAKWIEHAAKKMPPDALEALCLKLGTGFDPLTAPLTELQGMIGALKAEITRVAG